MRPRIPLPYDLAEVAYADKPLGPERRLNVNLRSALRRQEQFSQRDERVFEVRVRSTIDVVE